jgi:hypothetical protein
MEISFDPNSAIGAAEGHHGGGRVGIITFLHALLPKDQKDQNEAKRR